MTKKQHRQQQGFTLIEMIAVLVIVSILATLAGLGIVAGVQGYMFSKDNAAISEKAQLAIARINRELLECSTCSGTSGPVVVPFYNNLPGQRSIQLSGGNIVISDGTNTDILLDNVASFTMTYNSDKSITVRFQSSKQPGGVTVPRFETTVYPRNTP
jgi:prepilin-type N-terminal cleavage/methylation domain-containing protein